MRPYTARLVLAIAMGLLAGVAGCAEDDPLGRQAVSGRITIDASPLANGAIMLDPGSEHEGTAVGATIQDGAFTIERSEGPTPGIYKVRVYSSSGVQAPAPPGASSRKPRPMIERIPASYNTRTEKTITIRAEGDNRIDVDIHSEPLPSPSDSSP